MINVDFVGYNACHYFKVWVSVDTFRGHSVHVNMIYLLYVQCQQYPGNGLYGHV